MKRKVIALLLVAIMVFTACSAVAMTTTQKVAAASANTQSTSIIIDYKPGAKYIFKPNRFNGDSASYRIDQGNPRHFEFAALGAATSWVKISSTDAGVSYANTGIKVSVKGYDPITQGNNPCKITMHLSYFLATKGDTEAKVLALPGWSQAFWYKTAFGNGWQGVAPVQHGKETLTYQTVMYPTFRDSSGAVFIGAQTLAGGPWSQIPAAGQASSSVVVDYIEIQF
jgi:hypothetical protein